ncbi:MAG: UvrD-helicase domain-containing protein [Verrucomicrobia bacterium]|nr:UvrD-helicase domain-containing protein [Verrucomicrobiota bacterium]
MSISTDQEARERFTTELDRNFCVVAGAGSGKTTAIVERICRLAMHDRNALRRLVVVTYTKSAAIEFKSRSRQNLLRTASETDALDYLRALEQAYFGTIHGFCFNLIREFRSRLLIPEQPRVPTEDEQNVLWETFVTDSQELNELLQHPVTHSLLRVCTLSDLLYIAKRFRPSMPRSAPAKRMPIPDGTRTRATILNNKRSEEVKKRAIASLDAFAVTMSADAGFSLLPVCDSTKGKLIEAFKQDMAPLVKWLQEAAEWFGDRLARSFRNRCLQEGILSFNNQIDVCLELLQQSDILDQLRGREFIVIVDEAQDTDSRMFQIFVELTRPQNERFGNWPDAGKPPIPGRFCLVGDPRQTIFERGATSRFAKLCKYFGDGDGGELLRFNVTYRCAETVARRINELFASHEVEEVPLDDLAAQAGAPQGAVGRLLFNPGQPIDSEDEIEPLLVESDAVAQWLARVGPAGLGASSWSDLAIIAPRHDWLIIAGDALKKHRVPFSFFRPKVSRSGIAAFAWPVSLIYTLINPWDKFERYGVLREIFGVADTDLLRAAKGIGDPGLIYREAEKLLSELRKLCQEAGSLLYFVDRLLERVQLMDRLIAVGEATVGLDQLRWEAALADERGLSLEQFLEELLIWLQDSAEPTKAPAKGVELITIFSAKGLEWDWVIPIGLRKKFSSPNQPYPRVQNLEINQVVWSSVSERAARDEEAEKANIKRLLYVMLTRAKRGIVIATPDGEYRPGKQGTAFTEVVPDNAIELPLADEMLSFSEAERIALVATVLPVPGSRDVLGVPGAHGVPHVVELVRPFQLADDSPVLHLQFAEAAGAYDYGRWWHTWIEMFPWGDDQTRWEEYAQRAEPPAIYDDRAKKEIAALLANQKLREFCGGAAWFQAEFPFSWPKASVEWYEGVVDLMIARPDHQVIVIDWKTNQAAESETPDALAERLRQTYLPQLEGYRSALNATGKTGPVEIAIYSTVLGRFV